MSKDIILGNPTSILILGFRGVGKTSFVGKLEDEITSNNDKALFVKLNLSKYIEHPLLLRKITRELFLALRDSEKLNNIRKIDKDLADELNALYDRTFYEIQGIKKTLNEQETLFKYQTDLNLRKLVSSVALVILFMFNLIFDLSNDLNLFLFVGSLFWCLIEVAKFSIEKKECEKSSEEFQRKTLYDNEVAEYQLRKALVNLRKVKYHPVFVIDELDKIASEEKVDQIIGELKPLMLSGLATFILVSGQTLYYQYFRSQTSDDDVIANVFSKVEHIPMQSVETFCKIFERFVLNYNAVSDDELYEKYIFSKILQSKRLLRKFINLIRQDIRWDGESAYIDVDPSSIPALTTDFKLLKIATDLESKEMEFCADGMKDYFISQLYKWIQKMKLKRTVVFKRKDIFEFEREYTTAHALWYSTHLNGLIKELFEKMVDEGLIEEVVCDNNGEAEDDKEYRWQLDVAVNISDDHVSLDSFENLKMEFFIRYGKFEKIVSSLYIDAFGFVNKGDSVRKMISKLLKNEYLEKLPNEQLNWLIEIRNKIAHAESLTEHETHFLNDYKNPIANLENELMLQYANTIISQCMNKFEYNTNIRTDEHFDILCTNNGADAPVFIFEVASTNLKMNTVKNQVYKIANSLNELNKRTQKRNYAFILYFVAEANFDYASAMNRIKIMFDENFSKQRQDIYIWFSAEGHSLASFLKTNIESILMVYPNSNNKL